MKLSVIKSQVKDKNIVVVDDSMVRGTTAQTLVELLRHAGAKSVHLRIASATISHPCYYGASMPEEKKLIFHEQGVDAVCKMTGADSLAFLSSEGYGSCMSGCRRWFLAWHVLTVIIQRNSR